MTNGPSTARGDLRIAGVDRGRALALVVDGTEVAAFEGESVAAALAAAGHRLTRWTERTGEPRGYFCGMGVCQDCLLIVDGQPNVRACVTPVRDGMRVERQRGLGDWRVTP
jgi:predicted molibdopterin-dependent oxidoreductase YjgC